jgi:pyruvate dehydrogenase E2 component (dihydrolipoamide acetyltransferase)
MATEILLPQLGLTMNEGLLVEWRKKVGDTVRKGEILFLVENEKATIEVEAQVDGVLAKILVPEKTTVAVGTVVGLMAGEGEQVEHLPEQPRSLAPAERPAPTVEQREPPPARPACLAADAASSTDGFILASPLARSRAREEGLDLATVAGTGPGGAIVERDLPSSESEEISLSRIGAIAAERLGRSWATTPQFTVFVEMSALGLLDIHEAYKKRDLPVSLTVILAKLLAGALLRFPRLNAEWLGAGRVRVHRKVNVGIAMDTEAGLAAPVLRDCTAKSYRQLAEEMRALTERGRRGTFAVADLAGGTVTLSNLGMFGARRFNAIVNPPQTAIVSVGAVERRPVERSGSVVFEPRLEIGLTADHRAADGVYAARFLADLKASLEAPPPAGD